MDENVLGHPTSLSAQLCTVLASLHEIKSLEKEFGLCLQGNLVPCPDPDKTVYLSHGVHFLNDCRDASIPAKSHSLTS